MRSLAFPLILALTACPSPVGSEGPAGPKGDPGATGAPGATGPAGPMGSVGAEGPQGTMGAAGTDGMQGPAGPQGVQGPAGAVTVVDGGVVVGPPGSSVIVTPVTPGGMPCPNGGIRVTQLSDGGISHVCNGATITTTTLAVMSPQCAAGGLLINLPDGGATPVCNGVAGTIGATGPTGMTGPAGPIGMTGNAGAIGMTGPAGTPGPAGSAGVAGPVGPMGPPGAVLYTDGGIVLAQVTEQRPVLVGYTAFTSNGNVGSRTIANARCSAEFPGTHLCNSTEFRTSRSIQPIPGGVGAFLDYAYSGTSNDPDVNVSCANFTVGASGLTAGAIALPNGTSANNTTNTPNCGSVLPLACCTSPSYARLRGYTVFTSNGNIGSRTIANSRCNAEFPGTHLCNTTEFRLSRSIQPIPGGVGAFLDYAYSGTSTDPDVNVSCANFTVGTSGLTAGAIALPNGTSANNTTNTPNCGSTLPLACCD